MGYDQLDLKFLFQRQIKSLHSGYIIFIHQVFLYFYAKRFNYDIKNICN